MIKYSKKKTIFIKLVMCEFGRRHAYIIRTRKKWRKESNLVHGCNQNFPHPKHDILIKDFLLNLFSFITS